MNEVEGSPLGNGCPHVVIWHVVITDKAACQWIDVLRLELGNNVGVEAGASHAVRGARNRSREVVTHFQSVERISDGAQRRDEVRFRHADGKRSRRTRSCWTAAARSDP